MNNSELIGPKLPRKRRRKARKVPVPAGGAARQAKAVARQDRKAVKRAAKEAQGATRQ